MEFVKIFLCSSASTSTQEDNITESSNEESQSSQDEYEPPKKLASTPKDDKIHLSFPRRGLFSGSASDMACRIGISNRKQVAMTAQFIKMGGRSLKDVTLSISSAFRERDKAVSGGGDKILKEFITNAPEFIVLHWDGKVIHY